jgi:2-hydroxy-3-keto-5-methylthiopentenyl-1-phosphate phosphatase
VTRVDRDQAAARGAPCGAGNALAVMDFDGTVTARDCMVAVLERYVEDWPRVAAAARAEGLGEVAVIERGIGMLRLPRDQIVAAFVETAELRPGLGRFLEWLLGAGGSAAIVSAGIREAIESVLQANGLPAIPVFAAELDGDSVRGYTLALHEDFGDCPVCGRGRCKGPLTRGLRRPGQVVVAFGDGGRDLCMAREADLVFARGRLLRLCEREGIPARELTDFDAAAVELAAWLDGGALTGAMPVA